MFFRKKQHEHEWGVWMTVGKINPLGSNSVCGTLQVRKCLTCNQLEFAERRHEIIQPSQIIYYPDHTKETHLPSSFPEFTTFYGMLKKKSQTQIMTTTTSYYNQPNKSIRQQGIDAFNSGQPDTVCPYPLHSNNGKRLQWMSGYYEARTEKNVGHILKKKP